MYLEHGPIGAEDLAGIGASRLAIEFAGRHPGRGPDDLDADRWAVLLASDRA